MASASERLWIGRALIVIAGVASASALTAACGVSANPSTYELEPGGEGATDPGTAPPNEPPPGCTDGDVKDCHQTIGQNEGILSCLQGQTTCKGGVWGPCEGTIVSQPKQTTQDEAAGKQFQDEHAVMVDSLSDAGACVNNPCDPSCQAFNEQPDGGVKPDGGANSLNYQGGAVTDLPGGFQNKALKDSNHPPSGPCTSAADCQIDNHCNTVTGLCEPWLPGQKDPTCAGIDLTLGATCTNNVPVCNRGNTNAPAGAKIVVFNGNSSQMQANLGVCTSASMQGTVAGECVAPAIPAGKCVDVTCPPGVLGGTQSLVINPPKPPASTSPMAECSCANNWTVYSNGGSCAPVACSSTTTASTLTQVNMFIMFDNSGSMVSNGMWTPAKTAIKAFLQDAASAGLGVSLRFFGSNPMAGCDDNVCSATACGQAQVPLGVLKAATGASDAQETALVNAINSAPTSGNGTPIYPAVAGPEQWATTYASTHPNTREVVVFITDGDPSGCNTSWSQIDALASNAKASQNVLTYVVGLFGSNQANLNGLANAGGTGSAFFITQANTQTGLVAALNAIRGNALTCDVAIPNAANIDPNAVSATFTPSSGGAQGMTQVASAAACTSGNQFYLDNPATPTKLVLCPSICGTAQADVGSKVNISAACPAAYQQLVYKQTYQGSCPAGTHTQWGYFAYDSATPSDSNIVFQAHTAATSAGLASAPLATLRTAAASPNTQVCAIAGPSPCPIDLWNALGGKAPATNDYLEMVVTLNPSTNKSVAPTLNNWQVTFSCPPTE